MLGYKKAQGYCSVIINNAQTVVINIVNFRMKNLTFRLLVHIISSWIIPKLERRVNLPWLSL